MSERFERRCLSPFEWRFGWLKTIFMFAAFIATMIALDRTRGEGSTLAGAVALLALLAGVYFWPSKVTLLEDGLAYTRYGFSRFIAYSQIRKTEALQRIGTGASAEKNANEKRWKIYCGIRLHFRDGATLDIGTGTEELTSAGLRPVTYSIGDYGDFGAFNRLGWELKRELDERISANRSLSQPKALIAKELTRGNKSLTEWLHVIDGARPTHGDAYRGADEALWRVVEDEGSPREARAAAALALRSRLDEEGRHRMRVVVDGCESPKLRVALETALDTEAEEARLLEALEQASLPRNES